MADVSTPPTFRATREALEAQPTKPKHLVRTAAYHTREQQGARRLDVPARAPSTSLAVLGQYLLPPDYATGTPTSATAETRRPPQRTETTTEAHTSRETKVKKSNTTRTWSVSTHGITPSPQGTGTHPSKTREHGITPTKKNYAPGDSRSHSGQHTATRDTRRCCHRPRILPAARLAEHATALDALPPPHHTQHHPKMKKRAKKEKTRPTNT